MALLTPKETKRLKLLDKELIERFETRFPHLKRRHVWRSSEVTKIVKANGLGLKGLAKLESAGKRKGLFDIRLERRDWLDSDGERRKFTLARAASTEMFPMGTQFWVRDNAIIGARLFKSHDRAQRRQGKEILLSCLSFMSSVAQLKRFEAIIKSNNQSFIDNCDNWPHIFAAVADNLTTAKHEGWSHKQDAWQILAWHLLEALEDNRLALSDLSVKHKRFFGLIVPFLAKVAFWRCENSGSWEEIAAVRTSVRAWEHRLIVKVAELSQVKGYEFLATNYNRFRKYLGSKLKKSDLKKAVKLLDKEISRLMLKELVFECPMYPRNDARYRAEDAALIYLLELNYVQFLAERLGKSSKWAKTAEMRLLNGILKLQDDRSGGIYRYRRDTYQRGGFFRYLTAAKLVEVYGALSGDASANFAYRHHLVPKGRQAAWTHPVWQLAAWSAERFLATRDSNYKKLHDRFFTSGLKLITGKNEGSFDIDEKGNSRVIRVPEWRMPECYIADTSNSGEEMVFPSPHTPLNWAIAEMLNAFRVRKELLALLPSANSR
jgi:hypothetical protein